MGIESEIVTFPQDTGTDYLISNDFGSCAVQRKVAVPELISELDEILYDIAPRLVSFNDNPSLLVEENFVIDNEGYLMNRNDSKTTEMKATSYYGFLETIRKTGVDVYCTSSLNHSIWWMAAMHGYLGKEHYPKHRKYFTEREQAIGMLSCVPRLGEKRAAKALKHSNISGMCRRKFVKGLSEQQNEKLQKVLLWRDEE